MERKNTREDLVKYWAGPLFYIKETLPGFFLSCSRPYQRTIRLRKLLRLTRNPCSMKIPANFFVALMVWKLKITHEKPSPALSKIRCSAL